MVSPFISLLRLWVPGVPQVGSNPRYVTDTWHLSITHSSVSREIAHVVFTLLSVFRVETLEEDFYVCINNIGNACIM